jgi:uncharacterized protein with FMN-binding domain
MRKVITALLATAAGLIALLSFRSHTAPTGLDATGPAANTPQSTATAPPTATATATASSGSGSGSGSTQRPATGATSAPATTAAAKHAKDGTYTGTAVDTRYGPVQVSAVITGGKLTDVTVLQVPDQGRYEDQIVQIALPALRSEALSRQNAALDIVSGATYTSQGYAQSLQAALDRAGL